MTASEEHAWATNSQPRRADINSWSCFFAASSCKTTLFAFLPLASLFFNKNNEQETYLHEARYFHNARKIHLMHAYSFLSLPGRKYACKQPLNVWKPGHHLLKFNHHGLKVSYDIRMQTQTAISWLENEKYKRNATIRQKIEEIKIFSSKIKLEKLWEHLIIWRKALYTPWTLKTKRYLWSHQSINFEGTISKQSCPSAIFLEVAALKPWTCNIIAASPRFKVLQTTK